jgi:hypothetical protein
MIIAHRVGSVSALFMMIASRRNYRDLTALLQSKIDGSMNARAIG